MDLSWYHFYKSVDNFEIGQPKIQTRENFFWQKYRASSSSCYNSLYGEKWAFLSWFGFTVQFSLFTIVGVYVFWWTGIVEPKVYILPAYLHIMVDIALGFEGKSDDVWQNHVEKMSEDIENRVNFDMYRGSMGKISKSLSVYFVNKIISLWPQNSIDLWGLYGLQWFIKAVDHI